MTQPENQFHRNIGPRNVSEMLWIFTDNDDRLDEQAKRQHLIQSWEEITQMYPEQWVAIVITDYRLLAIEVFLNHQPKPYRLIFDTAATHTVLLPSVAREFKLSPAPIKAMRFTSPSGPEKAPVHEPL